MITVTTENSVYEIDVENLRTRRIKGIEDPTPRQGPDSEWKSYANLQFVDGGVFFDWDGEGHGTLTSPIVATDET